MECEKSYELRYGWRHIGSEYCYNGYEVFLTEEKINKFLFGLLHNSSIEIVWYKKIYIEDYKSW